VGHAAEASGSGLPRPGPGPRYKWVALSNTTLGVLIAITACLIAGVAPLLRGAAYHHGEDASRAAGTVTAGGAPPVPAGAAQPPAPGKPAPRPTGDCGTGSR
jgi:hypothetical protein